VNNTVKSLLHINPRYVYILVAIAVTVPMILNLRLPTVTSPNVELMYKEIESLAPDTRLILSMDYDPSTVPELEPMAAGVLRHCFKKGIRVFGMTMNLQGQNLGAQLMKKIAEENKIPNDGSRYVFVGFRIGPVLLQMGENLIDTFQTDFQRRDLRSLPMMKGVKNLEEFELCISLSGTSIGYSWINLPGTRYRKKIALGVTGVMAPNYQPYVQSGQLVGMLAGLKGAAEYEYLIGFEDKGKQGMGSQSAVHLVIILLIIAGNALYFYERRKSQQS
jgi:hypothetical protein